MKKFVLTLVVALVFCGLSGCGKKTQTQTPTTNTAPSTTNSTPVTSNGNTAPAGPTAAQIAQNVADIQLLTTNGINLGLVGLNAANPKDAKTTATQIQTIVGGVVLPLLKGSGNISTSTVNTILKEKFANGLPPIAASIITFSASILDRYIQQPSGDRFLTPEELQYAVAFFQSMSDGAGMFLASAPVVAPPAAPIKPKPPAATAPAKKDASPVRKGGWLNLTGK